MKKTLSALAAVAALSLAPLAPASAEEAPQVVGSLYAYAAVPVDCEDPGAVQINYVEGVRWHVDGKPVEVSAPSSRFEFPNGWQGAVHAEALPGYVIDGDVYGTAERPFWLTVNPTCDRVADASARIVALEAANALLEERVEAQAAKIERKTATIKTLRAKIRALRAAR